jgi:hypothetical protein
LSGTFTSVERMGGSGYLYRYWSSTKFGADQFIVSVTDFLRGEERQHVENNDQMSCRPVRLEPVP